MDNKFSPNTIETKKCLVIVSAKEHGMIYVTVGGLFQHIDHVVEHPPTYSDNEGFFTRGSQGRDLGSGAPREVDKEGNIKRYIKAVSEELNHIVAKEKPEAIFIFEPEHLKGLIVEHLDNPTHIPVQALDYGNFVHEAAPKIKDRIVAALASNKPNSDDPSSVKDTEVNAEEKRKILEIGKQRDTM